MTRMTTSAVANSNNTNTPPLAVKMATKSPSAVEKFGNRTTQRRAICKASTTCMCAFMNYEYLGNCPEGFSSGISKCTTAEKSIESEDFCYP